MIAVHCGAGYHSQALEAAYKRGECEPLPIPGVPWAFSQLSGALAKLVSTAASLPADLGAACRAGAAALAGGSDALAAVTAAIKVLEVRLRSSGGCMHGGVVCCNRHGAGW